jgi:hypothetical protein
LTRPPPGIIKDSIAGEDRIVAFLIELLRRCERHRHTLQAVARNLAAGSGGAGEASAAGGRQRQRRQQAPGEGAAAGGAAHQRRVARIAGALLKAVAADLPPAQWHPGSEDGEEGPAGAAQGLGSEARRRLELLLAGMGLPDDGGRDAERRRAACMQVLKAFRAGELGRYTLDDV